MKKRLILLTILSLCLLAHGALGADHEKKVTRNFDAGELESLRLLNLAGRVLIEGSSGRDVEVRAVIHTRDHRNLSAEEVAELPELRMELDGAKLVLETRLPLDEFKHYRYSPDKKGFFSDGNTSTRYGGKKVKVSTGRRAKGLPLWVDYHIRLPEGLDCDLRNLVGGVKLNAVAADCRVDCASAGVEVADQIGNLLVDNGSGDVLVQDMKGELRIDTGSGDLNVSGLVGDFDADTGSGDVELADASGGGLRADTGSGDVKLLNVNYPELRVDTGSGDVKVSSPDSEVDRWVLDTGSGDVTLVLEEGKASFKLEVDTGSGDVDCDLASSNVKIHGGAIRALTVGDGRGSIIVDTGSGDISIVKG